MALPGIGFPCGHVAGPPRISWRRSHDSIRHDVFPASSFFVHKVPGKTDDVDQKALGEPVLPEHGLRHVLSLSSEGDRPSGTLDIAIGRQAVEHLRDRRRRTPEPFGETGLNGRGPLFVQRLNGLQILLDWRMVLDRLVHDARSRHQSRIWLSQVVTLPLLDQRQLALQPVRVLLFAFQDLGEQIPRAVVAPLDAESNARIEACDRLLLERERQCLASPRESRRS